MMLYEFLDMTDAETIIICNKPYDVEFFLMQIDNGDTQNVNTLIWDAIESCDVHHIIVENNVLYIFLDETELYIDVDWDEDGHIDFYDLEKNRASQEIADLARSLGITNL